jgi:peroxiredoxin (alkyl hydroperoxide reductase subunit C)
MSLVGKQFPYQEVKAINYLGDISNINPFQKAVDENKKILLFWYPKDFSFVCPTEINSFQEKLSEFEKRDTIVIGASCDTVEVHFAWLNTPIDDGGIEGVTYPLISDTSRKLSKVLNILDDESIPYRATYLIDSSGEVFYESINHMFIGRKIDEYLRVIDAKILNEQKGEVCLADWENKK